MDAEAPIRQIRAGASHRHTSPSIPFAGPGTMFDLRGSPQPVGALLIEAEIGVDHTGLRISESYWVKASRADGSGKSPHFVLFGEHFEDAIRLCAAMVAVSRGGDSVTAYEGRNEVCEVSKDAAGFRARFYARTDGRRGRLTADIAAGFSEAGFKAMEISLRDLDRFRREALDACAAEIEANAAT